MTHFIVEPPEEMGQWEAEVALGRLINQLRCAMEGEKQLAKSLAESQQQTQELREAVTWYRERLGLPDCEIPMLEPDVPPLERVSDLRRHASQEGCPSQTRQPESPGQGAGND